MLRANGKLISFLLLPFLRLLMPIAIFVGSLLVHLTWFTSISFVGYPYKPWQKIPEVLKEFWKRYVTDTERLFENFGHPSGIPQDWDGRVYGMCSKEEVPLLLCPLRQLHKGNPRAMTVGRDQLRKQPTVPRCLSKTMPTYK